MKTTLLTTTALALTGFAGTASAVDIEAGAVTLGIKGSFATTAAISSANIGAGSDDAGDDYDGVDILTTSEIHFKPSITLDNGIKIGFDIELEGNTNSDQIDESTIFATGGFGHIELGSKDSAGKLLQKGAPDNSLIYAVSTSLTAFVPFDAPNKADFANDADRLTYFTPDFGGFQFGVSYARNRLQVNGVVNNNHPGIGTDYADIGLAYNGNFGDVSVGFSARYGTFDRNMKPNAAQAAMNAAVAAQENFAKVGNQADINAAAALVVGPGENEVSEEFRDAEIDRAAKTTFGKAKAAVSAAAALVVGLGENEVSEEFRDAAIKRAGAQERVANRLVEFADEDLIDASLLQDAVSLRSNAAIARDEAASASARPTIAGVGLQLGFGGGFSIGGGYVERDDKDGLSETKTYDIGVGYVNGPMAYSLTYVHDEQTGTSENELWVAAATYAVNGNFNVGASLSTFDSDTANDKGDIDGTIFGLTASFSF